VDVRFGSDLQMQRVRIRRLLWPWRGWPAWRRWRWFVPMGGMMIGLGVIGSALASAAAGARSDPPPESGDLLLSFLIMPIAYITSLIVSLVFAYRFLRPLLLQPSSLSSTPQLDDDHLAYLSFGPTRVLELGLASLVQQGVLRADPNSRELVLIGPMDEAMPGIAQQVLTVYRHLAPNGSGAVTYAKIVNLYGYNSYSQRYFLQSKKLLLKGLAKSIAQWSGPIAFLLITFGIMGLFRPHVPSLLDFIPPCLGGICLGIAEGSGRTIWGESVLKRYQSASSHADPLHRIALRGSAAMSGGRLDDLRRLIENVEADSATACGC